MRARAILGIDPGLSGAVAYLDETGQLRVFDLPRATHGLTKQNALDAKKLTEWLTPFAPLVSFAAVENVHSMPGQSSQSTFTFGFVAGQIQGVLGALGIGVVPIEPSVWKSSLYLTKDKQKSVTKARELFPDAAAHFTNQKDGRAEAALIAHFAMRLLCPTHAAQGAHSKK